MAAAATITLTEESQKERAHAIAKGPGRGRSEQRQQGEGRATMVLDIIIIAGVAGAMLGWNVHVMRENGVRPSSSWQKGVCCVCAIWMLPPTCTAASSIQQRLLYSTGRLDTEGTKTRLPETHTSRLSRLGGDRTRERRRSRGASRGGTDTYSSTPTPRCFYFFRLQTAVCCCIIGTRDAAAVPFM